MRRLRGASRLRYPRFHRNEPKLVYPRINCYSEVLFGIEVTWRVINCLYVVRCSRSDDGSRALRKSTLKERRRSVKKNPLTARQKKACVNMREGRAAWVKTSGQKQQGKDLPQVPKPLGTVNVYFPRLPSPQHLSSRVRAVTSKSPAMVWKQSANMNRTLFSSHTKGENNYQRSDRQACPIYRDRDIGHSSLLHAIGSAQMVLSGVVWCFGRRPCSNLDEGSVDVRY